MNFPFKKHLLAIDGTALAYRQLYGMPPLSREDGLEIGGFVGYVFKLLRLRKRSNFSDVVVAFDVSRETFRRQLFPFYKANRSEDRSESDLLQIELMKKITPYLGAKLVTDPVYEADDLIASWAVQFPGDVTLVAPDKDYLQLVSKRISLLRDVNTPEAPLVTVANFSKAQKWKIEPRQALDYQALIGDSIDGVDNVHGIGPAAAATILNQGTLHEILLNPSVIERRATRLAVLKNWDRMLMARNLVRLRTDIYIKSVTAEVPPNPALAIALCKALHAHRVVTTLSREFRTNPSRIAPDSKWRLSTDSTSGSSARSLFPVNRAVI